MSTAHNKKVERKLVERKEVKNGTKIVRKTNKIQRSFMVEIPCLLPLSTP